MRTVGERFWAKILVDPVTGCWLWQGARTTCRGEKTYGTFRMDGKSVRPHVWAWEQLNGPKPKDGRVLDHFECDNKACANPTHVRLVTQRENILRSDSLQALNAAKTHCHRGHEFTPENIYERPDGRECRACMAENYLTRDKDKHNEARRHRRAMGARN